MVPGISSKNSLLNGMANKQVTHKIFQINFNKKVSNTMQRFDCFSKFVRTCNSGKIKSNTTSRIFRNGINPSSTRGTNIKKATKDRTNRISLNQSHEKITKFHRIFVPNWMQRCVVKKLSVFPRSHLNLGYVFSGTILHTFGIQNIQVGKVL